MLDNRSLSVTVADYFNSVVEDDTEHLTVGRLRQTAIGKEKYRTLPLRSWHDLLPDTLTLAVPCRPVAADSPVFVHRSDDPHLDECDRDDSDEPLRRGPGQCQGLSLLQTSTLGASEPNR